MNEATPPRLRPRPGAGFAPGAAPQILRVIESPRVAPAPGGCRTWSVFVAGRVDDLAVVATARDPADPLAFIPSTGEGHPDDPALIGGPPEIHPVGVRHKQTGQMLAERSGLFNVRVRYEAGREESPPPSVLSLQAPDGEGGN